ncbi:hypothetical protein [Burkholderia ubonensis]|nr:hypothetical protein [Burkholderia ubonensis]
MFRPRKIIGAGGARLSIAATQQRRTIVRKLLARPPLSVKVQRDSRCS